MDEGPRVSRALNGVPEGIRDLKISLHTGKNKTPSFVQGEESRWGIWRPRKERDNGPKVKGIDSTGAP